jgi:HPt (histidine-containing phosphotransfer) domain-containing protein
MTRNIAVAVDYQHLQSQAADNVDVMREVLQLFVAHGEQVLAELDKTTDEKTWKLLVHTLKGSARGIGAFEVAEAAAHAENYVLDNSKIEPLKQAFAKACSFIVQNPM